MSDKKQNEPNLPVKSITVSRDTVKRAAEGLAENAEKGKSK